MTGGLSYSRLFVAKMLLASSLIVMGYSLPMYQMVHYARFMVHRLFINPMANCNGSVTESVPFFYPEIARLIKSVFARPARRYANAGFPEHPLLSLAHYFSRSLCYG